MKRAGLGRGLGWGRVSGGDGGARAGIEMLKRRLLGLHQRVSAYWRKRKRETRLTLTLAIPRHAARQASRQSQKQGRGAREC